MNAPLFNSTVPELPLVGRGKVRDIYDMGNALLIVATDRISCFDVVLPTPIPDKGAVLKEILRVLKPGGSLYLADVVVQRELTLEARSNPELWAACIAGALVPWDGSAETISR